MAQRTVRVAVPIPHRSTTSDTGNLPRKTRSIGGGACRRVEMGPSLRGSKDPVWVRHAFACISRGPGKPVASASEASEVSVDHEL